MNNEERILEMLMALQQSQAAMQGSVAVLQQTQAETQNVVAELHATQQDMLKYLVKMDERLTRVEGTVARIEVEHGAKINAALDGVMQNAQKLDRIEAEVSKHEEVIFRRMS